MTQTQKEGPFQVSPYKGGLKKPMCYEVMKDGKTSAIFKDGRNAEVACQLANHAYSLRGAEVDALRAVVDKLPKCWRLNEAGQLVQDVPVIHDMMVYTRDYGQCSVLAIYKMRVVVELMPCDSGRIDISPTKLYSTEAAAAAAKESQP